jgi:hypothetical protein
MASDIGFPHFPIFRFPGESLKFKTFQVFQGGLDNRSLFGHWESDLMQFRTQKGNLLAAVERKAGLTLASGLPSKTA